MRYRNAIVGASAMAILIGFAGVAPTGAQPASTSTTAQTYVVLYKAQGALADSGGAVTKAGGTIVASYPAIGVVIARSSNTAFRANVMRSSAIGGAAATTRFATSLANENALDATDAPLPDSAPATDSDSLSGLQWDMVQIHT